MKLTIICYGNLLLITTVNLLTKSSNALECYAGLTSQSTNNGLLTARCSYGIGFCMKYTFPIISGAASQVERNCDVNGLCLRNGVGCFYDEFSGCQLCCCNTDKCNSANTSTINLLLLLLLISSCILLRYL